MLQYSPLVQKQYEAYRQKFKKTHPDTISYQSVAQSLQHKNVKIAQQRLLNDLSSMFTMLQVKLNVYPHPIITTQIEPYFQQLIADPLNHLDDWRILSCLDYANYSIYPLNHLDDWRILSCLDYANYSIYPLKHLMKHVHAIKNPTENYFIPDVTASSKINEKIKHDTAQYRLIRARRDLDWYFKLNPKMSLTNQMLKAIFSTFLLSYRGTLDYQIHHDNQSMQYIDNSQASNWFDLQSKFKPQALQTSTISFFMELTISKLLDLTNYLSRMIDYFQSTLLIY